MKKVIVSVALATAFGGVAYAEESGAFVGVDLGVQNAVMVSNASPGLANLGFSEKSEAATIGNFRYGLMAGYKWFFTQSIGLRAYATINNSKNIIAGDIGYNALNLFANADLLYDIYTTDEASAGLFAGISIGYGWYNGGRVKATQDSIKQIPGAGKIDPSGVDFGINFGLRTIFARNHGLEFFTRFGLYHTQAKVSTSLGDIKMHINQPYAFGVRYVFNF